MDILIKGMKMPSECRRCKLKYWDGEEDVCPFVGDIASVGRHDHCSLVPVPPHGDLIGREWLIDIALHLMNAAKNNDIYNGVKWLLQYIINAPTIIPASEEGER